MAWERIIDGELADRAWEVVRGIAGDLAVRETPAPDAALFWSYLAGTLGDPTTASHHDHALDRFVAEIERGYSKIALYGGGLAGAAWVAAHVTNDLDDFLDLVDEKLVELLATTPWPGDYDLMTGLVGLAVYFLERGDAAGAREGLRRIVGHLDAMAEHADGITWHTPARMLPPHQLGEYPNGYHNCGLAHGVPGVIAVLSRIARRPDAPPEAAVLRDGAIRWLAARRLGDLGFPATADATKPTRLAWCYGDAGVTIALHSAADRAPTDLPATIRRWMSREDTGVEDAGLCHGAIGLAHIANRLYQATGEVAYRDYARTWIERTLALHRSGDPDVLTGSAGVGLGLLAALGVEPGWDRLLLCDL
jgi:lantibiotic biosynthesis protein